VAADPAVGRADAGLWTKASSEAAAAQLLFERHGDRVLAYCRRRLSSPEEAEDALQTTFLYACRGLQRGVVPETEIAWLLKIAHNVCLSHWDSDRRRRRLELVRDPERIEASTPAAAGARDDLHALEAALAGLTDLQRRAIVLREWRGLSYQEIAAELELSQAAVETLIFRARRALATSLEEQEVAGSRTRTRVVRGLDLGGLLAGLKSLLGGGGAAKLAATGLTVGAAVLAGSIPDVPKRAGAEPGPLSAPRSVGAPATVDPATAPSARAAAAAEARSASKAAAAKAKRAEKRKPQRSKRAPAEPGQSSPQQPTVGETVGQVTTGLGATVNGTVDAVTGTVNGTVETVTETVNGTVGTVNETVNGTVGTLPQVVGPTLEVVNGVLGGNGALLP
jgi:RNA polymerase sigma-70 factor (ECF subfamily)